jgi:hypothetical protein
MGWHPVVRFEFCQPDWQGSPPTPAALDDSHGVTMFVWWSHRNDDPSFTHPTKLSCRGNRFELKDVCHVSRLASQIKVPKHAAVGSRCAEFFSLYDISIGRSRGLNKAIILRDL